MPNHLLILQQTPGSAAENGVSSQQSAELSSVVCNLRPQLLKVLKITEIKNVFAGVCFNHSKDFVSAG